MKLALVLLTSAALGVLAGCSVTAEPEASGDSAQAIIGGTRDTGHAYVVGVGTQTRVFCSGTVIGKRTVLTAAHCVAGGIKAVFIGSETSGPNVTKISVETVIRHPSFRSTGGKLTNDLAILKLATAAPVQPAPLFRGTMDNSPTFVGPKLTYVGFGDDTLATGPQGETSGLGTKRVTHFAIDKVGAGEVGGTTGTIDDTMFWYSVPGISMCHGDSGGPSFFLQDGVEHLIGVTSFGDPTCASDGVQARADAPQIAAFIQPNLDAFEGNDACRSDGACNESCNAGDVIDPDCHATHAGADGVCSAAAESDPDCRQ